MNPSTVGKDAASTPPGYGAALSRSLAPDDRPQLKASFCFCSLVLTLLALCLLVLDPIKYAVIEGSRSGTPALEAAASGLQALWLRTLGLGVLAVALLVLTVRIEVKERAFSELLDDGGSASAFAIFGLSLLLWFVQGYIYPGHLLAGDTGAHIVRIAHFGRGLSELKVLYWDNYFYLGCPLLQFYAPLFFWLGGAFYAVIDDIAWATKLLLLILHLASGIFFFAFLREAGLRRIGALIGSIGYAGAWAHGNLVFYKGVLPVTVVIALLPAAFLLSERLIRQDSRLFGWIWAILAVVAGSMIAAHQAHGVFAGILLAFYILGRLWQENRLRSHLVAFASAGALGVGVSAFAVVPFALEKDWVVASVSLSPFELHVPTVGYFRDLLFWSNSVTSLGRESVAYIGIVLVLLSLVSLRHIATGSLLARSQKTWGVILLCGLVFSVFVRGPMVRDIIFTLFFVSALAGLGADCFAKQGSQWRRLPLMLVALMFLDLGPTAVQPVARTDKAYLDKAGEFLATHAHNERVMLTNTRTLKGENGQIEAFIGPTGTPLTYYPVQTVGGAHNHTATTAHNFAVAIIMQAEGDINTGGRLSEKSATRLALLNVSRVVNDNGAAMGLPDGYSNTDTSEPLLGRQIKVPEATPVIFAATLSPLQPPTEMDKPVLWREDFRPVADDRAIAVYQYLDQYFDLLAADLEMDTADTIPVMSLSPEIYGARSLPDPEKLEKVISIHRYHVNDDEVALELEVKRDGYVQFAHPWYPMVTVYDNGERVKPIRGSTNLIVVPVSRGSHVFLIHPERSKMRIIFGALSMAALALTLSIPVLNAFRLGRSRGAELTVANNGAGPTL